MGHRAGRVLITQARARVVVATLVLLTGVTGAGMALAAPTTVSPPTPYQVKLRAQVDTPAGAPKAGRDPAKRKQVSLAAAARQPVGNGARVAKPARNRTADHVHDVTPGQVIPNPAVTGRLASGCATGYGAPGKQCVPARGPADTALTCSYLVRLFPKGVAVTGRSAATRDPLKLDKNGNGIACDAKDRT